MTFGFKLDVNSGLLVFETLHSSWQTTSVLLILYGCGRLYVADTLNCLWLVQKFGSLCLFETYVVLMNCSYLTCLWWGEAGLTKFFWSNINRPVTFRLSVVLLQQKDINHIEALICFCVILLNNPTTNGRVDIKSSPVRGIWLMTVFVWLLITKWQEAEWLTDWAPLFSSHCWFNLMDQWCSVVSRMI